MAPSEKTCPACPNKIGDPLQISLKEIRYGLAKELQKQVAKTSVEDAFKEAHDNINKSIAEYDKTQQDRVESDKGRVETSPFPTVEWPSMSQTQPKCAFDGLPPGTYWLFCGCPKCSAYSLASPKIGW